jgi:hypothetical protein
MFRARPKTIGNNTPRLQRFEFSSAFEVLHLNRFQPLVAAALAVAAAGPGLSAQAASCLIEGNDVHQRIDGFGGGMVFLNPASLDLVTGSNMDALFDTHNANQLGLTRLRIRIGLIIHFRPQPIRLPAGSHY